MESIINNIVAENPGGIANRIKCLISMWRICDKYNKKLYLNWELNHTCGAEFNRLFENEFNLISTEELKELKDSRGSQTWKFLPLPEDKIKDMDFAFEGLPEDTKKIILSYLNKLTPIKVIRNIVENFSNAYNVKNLVGVHIRRDDFKMRGKNDSDVASDELFIERMNELIQEDNNTKFLLCTDSQEVEDKFINEFPNKIIVYKKKNRDRTSKITTQQGLIDMLLLSKTKHIIGTYMSTFNELAWWFGGCKVKVDIIKDEKLYEEYTNRNNKLDKSIIRKLKQLIFKLFKKIRIFKRR